MQLIPDTVTQNTSLFPLSLSLVKAAAALPYAEQHLYIIVVFELENLLKTRSTFSIKSEEKRKGKNKKFILIKQMRVVDRKSPGSRIIRMVPGRAAAPCRC